MNKTVHEINNHLMTKTIIVWILLVIFTALAINIVFHDVYILARLPWMRTSIIMSTFTCLWMYVMCMSLGGNKDNDDRDTRPPPLYVSVIFIVFLMVPLNIILCFPGYKTLGVSWLEAWPDCYSYLTFSLMAIHGTSVWVLQRCIIKHNKELKKWWIGVAERIRIEKNHIESGD